MIGGLMMFKLKYDDFLVYDELSGTYSMPQEQKVRDETERNHWKTTGFTILKDWRLYAMLIPMILVYLLWKYLPMYELVASFKSGREAQAVDRDWVGITNFAHLFQSGSDAIDFWRAFRNTFTLAFYGLLFGFPFPIILALFFNEVRSNIARSVMQVCVYLPKFLSTVIVTTLVISLFRGTTAAGGEMGIVSKFLTLIFGADSRLGQQAASTSGLIQSVRYFRMIYIVAELWEHAGYDSIVFFAAVIAVSPTSYEAAQIDGAGKMAQMRYVVLPSILSTVVIMLIMKMGSLLSVGYEKLWLFCNARTVGNYEVASVVSTLANMWNDNGSVYQGYGIAAEMMNNLIGMILVIGSNFIARRASDVSLY